MNIFQGYHKGLPVIKLNAVCHENSLSVDLLVTSLYWNLTSEGVFQSLEKSWDFSPTVKWIFLFKILNKQCGVQEYPLIEYILETSVTLTANLYTYTKKSKKNF